MGLGLVSVGAEAAGGGFQDGVFAADHPTGHCIDECHAEEDGGGSPRVLAVPGQAAVCGGHDRALPADGETVPGVGKGHPEELGGGARQPDVPVVTTVRCPQDRAERPDRPTGVGVYEHHVVELGERGVVVVLGFV
jgi:hypothetical protein